MLVLSREPGQRIMIGEDVVIEVVSVRGDRVRLAIDAPREVIVDREEVHERRKREVANNEE